MQTQELKIPVEEEMKSSYLDYAMSVIVGRALPEIRDGLKPVQRRILYAMFREGLLSNRKYSKCAGVVGEVLKKYHPHGDMAVYDALVRMAQDFNMRYSLIDGQGNFGSIDGDPPAAYRYTEARLTNLSEAMLSDIDKETVDFVPNFDETTEEPVVLPTRVPNLLINGSSGIAVGMATNIPPHNIGEIIDGLVMILENPLVTTEEELMEVIKGPDFPTGGVIHGNKGIIDAYTHGRGLIQIRAKARIERDHRSERESIVVIELPYQVNKARLMEKIAELIRDKKIEGISELRDESARDGIRIVMELKRGEIAEIVLNQLYKHTQMQTTFGIIMLALVNNQPRILNLKRMLHYFIQHRRQIVLRRSQFELRKAEERAHILEGIKIALEHIDEVIVLIKRSKTPEEAKIGLSQRFSLTDIQAQAILEMKLQRLTGLERDKVIEERDALLKEIDRLKQILGSEILLRDIIKNELIEIKKSYADNRRTDIVEETTEITVEDLITEEDMVVTISHQDYIKRNPLSLYRSQRRGGKGATAMETKEEDFVKQLFVASTHSYMLFFTDAGRAHWLKVHQIPEAGRAAKGKAIVNLLPMISKEKIATVLPVRDFKDGRYLVAVTKKGIVKKTELSAYSNPRAKGIIAISIDEDDELISVKLTDGRQEILLCTKRGLSIRFKEEDIRSVGRTARGVKGITLGKEGHRKKSNRPLGDSGEDEVVGIEIITEGTTILTVTENGYGKRTAVSGYPIQSRGGKGVITIKATSKVGNVAGIAQVSEDDEIMMVTAEGKAIRVKIKEIPVMSRNTQGVKLFDIDKGDKVVCVTILAEKEETDKEI
ncbi:MAG: DNA gyrase subunit A [Nitrospirota bacterium]